MQVVSPLTLSHKIELVKAGVHARKLSEEAEKIKADVLRLSRAFKTVDDEWVVFYGTHLRNLVRKADEVDSGYTKVRDEFNRIAQLAGE